MDLDDSFTEKLLNRTKARREYLTVKKNESPLICSKKRPVLSEEQQIINEDLEDVVGDDSPKRQRLSLPSEDTEYEKENVHMEEIEEGEAFMPYKASSNRGLAALRNKHNTDSGDDNTSSGSTSKTEVNECQSYMFSTNSSELCTTRKTRLANLASHINQWEDDLSTPHTTNNVSSTSLKKPVSNSQNFSASSHSKSSAVSNSNKVSFDTNALSHKSGVQGTFMFGDSLRGGSNSVCSRMPPVFGKGDIESGGECSKITQRIGVWEQAVKAALESDENSKPPLKTPVNAQWNKVSEERESSAEESEEENEEEEEEDSVVDNFEQDEKLNNKHLFGTVPNTDNLDQSFDPTQLPLSARKALFEKALLGGSTQPSLPPEKLSVAQRAAMFDTAQKNNTKIKPPSDFVVQKSAVVHNSSPVRPVKDFQAQHSPSKSVSNVAKSSPIKKIASTPSQPALSPGKSVGLHTRQVQQQLVKSVANNKEVVTKAAGERKTEISNLVSHWENLCSASNSGNTHSEEEVFRKQSPEEMYESEEEEEEADYESDLESERNEKDSESDWNERNEVATPQDLSQSDLDVYDSEQEVFNPRRFSAEAGLTNFDVDTDCTTDNDTGSYCGRPNSNYNSVSSDSISFKSSVSEPNSYSVTKSQTSSSGGSTSSYRTSDLSEEVAPKPCSISSSTDSPLCHTVSFYRKQKQVSRTPPLKTIVRREPIVEVPENEEEDQAETIQERIKMLQDEILRQQTVISQTSQALNLCHATAEFSGSTEQVEGERLLLIATQKRQASLNEIQRLKSHGAQGQNIADGSGTLTISDIQLPLKRDFISAQLEGKLNDTVHCFLCLIRHGPQVIVTQMVSTSDKISDGALCFTNHIKLQKLPPDFSVVFEVYALQTKKEVLPHDKKYHIKKDHSKVRLTPKGKKNDGKLFHPGVSSPGGPNAVRSPSFSVIGFTRFTIQNHNKKCFTLDKVPFASPLEGVLKVRLHLHAEHSVAEKGFLTMFEDVSGFGAWHRRWCSLDSRHLSFWKYPDDEVKKEPIGVVDLRQCVTTQVRLVSRDICARPHTFQLLIMRPQAKGDKNTLVSQSMDTLTSTKHLISADTKEERIAWCHKLNEALTNLRKWDPKALRPIEEKQE